MHIREKETLIAITEEKNREILELRNTLEIKDSRIQEVSAALDNKDLEIKELRSILENKDNEIMESNSNLESEKDKYKLLTDKFNVETLQKEQLLTTNLALENQETIRIKKIKEEMIVNNKALAKSKSLVESLEQELQARENTIKLLHQKSNLLQHNLTNSLAKDRTESLVKLDYQLRKIVTQLHHLETKVSKPVKVMHAILQQIAIGQKSILEETKTKLDLVFEYKQNYRIYLNEIVFIILLLLKRKPFSD